MRIVEVTENKKQYLDLLLLADEQEDMVDRYLYNGKMYVLDDDGVKCECVVTDEGTGILEIKNIATVPSFQRKGYAKALIEFLVEKYRRQFSILQVGTGDSPLTIPLYYRVVVFIAPIQGLCYTVRDAVDWFRFPTARRFLKGSNHSPLQYC